MDSNGSRGSRTTQRKLEGICTRTRISTFSMNVFDNDILLLLSSSVLIHLPKVTGYLRFWVIEWRNVDFVLGCDTVYFSKWL
jgi:hypothetical protein